MTRPRPITPEDVEAWAQLLNAVSRADDFGETFTAVELEEDLRVPGFVPATDTLSWWAGEAMIASVEVSVRQLTGDDGLAKAFISGFVHPDHRGLGLGTAIMEWGQQRALALAAHRHLGSGVQLDTWNMAGETSFARLAADWGYSPVRYFSEMRIELAGWPAPEPDGRQREILAASSPIDDDLREPAHRAHLDAFRDHWNFTPGTIEKWVHFTTGSTFRPEYSRLALDPDNPDDPVDAYVLCQKNTADELYVALVGTRRRARGRGLATALLADVVRQAKEAGLATVTLGVDSASPTGANGIYERIGFRPERPSVEYSKRLPAPS
ncbi:putative acetyltransferase, GNAT [Zhihengliuella salsuginis]|uniref:Acetyltransferase, GNAT n=2 Tax=Zhihengliuella salsuginis TaxID=578222 RepID=A0ABQ3GLC0_9MICC|nr:putative acetyltransferase, GNAT [Zhihengliuella salsuginis]